MDNSKKHFRITEITGWDVNRPLVRANADHNGDDYNAALDEAQEVAREALNVGAGMNLPFVCEAESAEDALAQYADKYYSDELAIPVDAEIEEVRKFEVTRQIDCQDTVVVFAKDADEALDRANEVEADKDELEILEIHNVRTTDAETGAAKELYL